MIRGSTAERTRATGLIAGLVLLLFAVLPVAAQDALDGALEVRSAFVSLEKGVFQLTARVQYPANEQIQQALKDGVTLGFDLQVVVKRHRRMWFDAGVLDLTRRRELVYQAVSERYLVRDLETHAQEPFPTLDEALAYIAVIDAWPITVESQLDTNVIYEVAVRAGVRRGRMPGALRTIIFWSDSWHRESDWYSWSLGR